MVLHLLINCSFMLELANCFCHSPFIRTTKVMWCRDLKLSVMKLSYVSAVAWIFGYWQMFLSSVTWSVLLCTAQVCDLKLPRFLRLSILSARIIQHCQLFILTPQFDLHSVVSWCKYVKPSWTQRLSPVSSVVWIQATKEHKFGDLQVLSLLPIFPGASEAPEQNFNDGLMEVFCLVSSLHIAQLQVGLGEPIRLGQCSSLKVLHYIL